MPIALESAGWITFWFGLWYFYKSVYFLKYNERGAIFRMDERYKKIEAGWHFYPWFLYTVIIFPTDIVQEVLPDEMEDQEKEHEDAPSPGKKVPFRIVQSPAELAHYYVEVTGTEPAPEDATSTPGARSAKKWESVAFEELPTKEKEAALKDGLQGPLTSEPTTIVRWRIGKEDDDVFEFVKNVGRDPKRAFRKVRRQLSGNAESTLQHILGPITVRNAINAKPHIQQELRKELEILTGEREDPNLLDGNSKPMKREGRWGIDIVSVEIQNIDPGEHVNKAQSEYSASIETRKKTVQDAEATKTANDLQTDMLVRRERELGQAKAAAYESQGKVLETVGGQRAGQNEIAMKMAENAGVIVVPGDPAGAIASISAIATKAAQVASGSTAA